MHLQSLKLLHPMVKEEVHLQENILFNLDLAVMVILNVAWYLLHHVTYAPSKIEVARSNSLGGDVFTRKKHYLTLTWSRSHEMLPSYPLHHVTYTPANFEVPSSKG